MESFGFVLSPNWDPLWSPDISTKQPKFIALDNNYFMEIDLSKDRGQEAFKLLGI